MGIKLIFNQSGSTGLLEEAVLLLIDSGINTIYSESKETATIMSVLYVFSKERIANAIAALCNNEIIFVDYKKKRVSYTPVFKRLLNKTDGWDFNGKEDKKNIIENFTEKCQILNEIEPHISFSIPLRKINLKRS